MARLNPRTLELAREIIDRYPKPKSALIPLLHVAQEQDGFVSDEAMVHIAELLDVTPAEVLGTCSFYEMFRRHEVGTYMINICTNISCQLLGADELLHHAETSLGIKAGNTTADHRFTLEDVECIAACTEAPCLQVNYRYEGRMSNDRFDELIDDLRSGRRHDVPEHGTLARVRQHVPPDRATGPVGPDDGIRPVWLPAPVPEGS